MRRILTRIALIIAGLSAVAFIAIAALIYATTPNEGGIAHLPGLTAPVTVTFGPRGVPFIQAANRNDAAEALGYLHARARLFQMDITRRAGAGTLAAWFGPRALAFDEHMRTLDLLSAAQASRAELSPPTIALLAAYARGVNARIAQCGRFCAWQYLIYGPPKPWHIVDSLLWGELLANELSGNAEIQLQRLTLSKTLSRAKIDSLWPRVTPPPPTLAQSEPPGTRNAARQALAAFPRTPSPFRRTPTESNEFAVSPARSATGAPILAGDPHLGFAFPSLWYLARIDTPHQTLAGATAPGVPFLIFGHNRHIAWTFTNNGAAVQDIITFKRLTRKTYLTPTGPRHFHIRDELIKVAGHHPTHFTVRTTIDGPVLALTKHRILALDAVNLTPHDHAPDGLAALQSAHSIPQAQAAAALITSPVQNLLVASRHRIALIVTGCVPTRTTGDGAWPIDGSTTTPWTGLACGNALPRFIAPASHTLINTNEQVAPPNFPIDFGPDQFGDWRSKAIRHSLAKHRRLTVKNFIATDYSIRSTYALALLPHLVTIHPTTNLAQRAVTLLRHWNGRMARNLPQPLIFNAWLRQFRLDILAANHVPPTLAGPATMQFVQALITNPAQQSIWCPHNCTHALTRAADQATAALARQYGPSPRTWRWGRAHHVVFYDPLLAAIPLIGPWLMPSISVPGDGSTVDRSAPGPTGWTATLGPSYRGIYDLADLNRSRFTMAPGQSGDVFSSQSRDFLKSWRDGPMITLPRHPAQIRATLVLRPSRER